MGETINQFQWRSRSAFVVVTAAAILSLNDFLTLPILAGEHGGGAFLMLYLLFLGLLGLPLMMAELMLGRISRTDPVHGLELLAQQSQASACWKLVGFLAVIVALLVVSTLSVISGWALAYFFKSALGVYQPISVETASMLFDQFVMDSERMAFWHTLFVVLLVSMAAQPVKIGIQKLSFFLLPMMLVLLMIALAVVVDSPGFTRSVKHFLYADFSAINAEMVLLALQRAFYTLALGIGVMMAFGRYMPSSISIGYSAGLVITVDLLFSLFIGLVIHALMFSSGMITGFDHQFAFRLLPAIFAQYPFGEWFGALFFLLLFLAALTTSIALMEGPVGYLQRQFHHSRLKAAIMAVLSVWLLGMGVVFSYNVWQGDEITLALFLADDAVRLVNAAGFHDILIFFSSYLIQPVVALLICLFVAWVMPRAISFGALSLSRRYQFEIWHYLMRYITPALLLAVCLKSIGVI